MKTLFDKYAQRHPFFPWAAICALAVIAVGVRAQSWEQQGFLRAELISFNQVPSVIAKGHGRFEAELNADGTITFALSYVNISSPVLQAHIHFGASKTNGGVMVFLCGGDKQACPASGTVTGTITAADVSTLPADNADSVIPQGIQAADIAAMLAAIRSGNSYINVHSSTFPKGEIRGQVQIR
jgi:hypothetical protein